MPVEAVEQAANILQVGVQDAAAKFCVKSAEDSDDTKQAITTRLKQDYSVQTLRMAATIIINALVFHENLAGQHGVRSLEDTKVLGVPMRSEVLNEWRKILKVNYWSIFSLASEVARGHQSAASRH